MVGSGWGKNKKRINTKEKIIKAWTEEKRFKQAENTKNIRWKDKPTYTVFGVQYNTLEEIANKFLNGNISLVYKYIKNNTLEEYINNKNKVINKNIKVEFIEELVKVVINGKEFTYSNPGNLARGLLKMDLATDRLKKLIKDKNIEDLELYLKKKLQNFYLP